MEKGWRKIQAAAQDDEWAYERALASLRDTDRVFQRHAWHRLEQDFGYVVASKAWRRALDTINKEKDS